ncbi:hypothetical protein NQZ68_032034 [Dissostichus eleginoides]|nr:hypothetical protein NQZ68_032034 [Dissostichus eleginoides]
MFLICCHLNLVFLTLTHIYTCTNSPSFPHLDSIKLYRDHPPLNTSYNREVKRGLRGLTEHELEKESQGEEEERVDVEVRGSRFTQGSSLSAECSFPSTRFGLVCLRAETGDYLRATARAQENSSCPPIACAHSAWS